MRRRGAGYRRSGVPPGHVLDRAVVGSLEFGVAELGIPLIVVLGHESCGAVKAAIAAADAHAHAEGSIDYLVEAGKLDVIGARYDLDTLTLTPA
jgi:carbonic anhydrase